MRLTIDDAELARTYDSEFFEQGAYADYVGDRLVHQKNFAKCIDELRRYRPGGRLFEIGAAHGFFLELAARHWRVGGVDISAKAAAHARKEFGLDVACADFLELPVEEEAYDIVAMWDTIEHLRRPSEYIAKVSRILKPGGIVALTTGNVGSVVARLRGRRWRLYHPPFHIHYFSPRTITLLLGRFDLGIVVIRSAAYYRSVDTMLYRMLAHRKPAISAGVGSSPIAAG